jgi:hypothetical protein
MAKVVVIEMQEETDLGHLLPALRELLPPDVTVYGALRQDAEQVMAVFRKDG